MIILLSKSEDKRNQLEVVAISDLVPQDHLLRKVDKVVNSGLKMLFYGGLKMSFFSGLSLSHA